MLTVRQLNAVVIPDVVTKNGGAWLKEPGATADHFRALLSGFLLGSTVSQAAARGLMLVDLPDCNTSVQCSYTRYTSSLLDNIPPKIGKSLLVKVHIRSKGLLNDYTAGQKRYTFETMRPV